MFRRTGARCLRRPAHPGLLGRIAFHPLEPRKLLFGDPVFNVGALDGSNGFRIPGVEASGELGFSITAIGDLNADGISDLAVSAPAAGDLLQNGRVYIVFGAEGLGASGQIDLASLDGSNGFVINGIETAGHAGWSLSSAGDVNGDMIADLIIGTPFADKAYILYGRSGIGAGGAFSLGDIVNGANGVEILGGIDDSIGLSVAGIGDLNNDGYGDVALGSITAFNAAGAAYVVFGDPNLGTDGPVNVTDLDGFTGLFIPGLAVDDDLGWRVGGAGDLNNDGIADLVVGALEVDSNGAGSAYVIFGKSGLGQNTSGFIDLAGLDGSNGFVVQGPSVGSLFSFSVSGGGDVNGDEIDDLIVGSITQNAYVIFGAAGIGGSGVFSLSTLNGSNGYTVLVPLGSGAFATHAGDLNNDGVGDVAIAGYALDEVYVFVGGPDVGSSGMFDVSMVDGENGFIIQGVSLISGIIGEPISLGKDVNNDGRDDLLIGAAATNQNTGEAYVLFGISITNLSAPVNLTATALDGMSIELQWEDTTLFEDGFELERSLDGVTGWTQVTLTPPSSGTGGFVTYPDGSLNPNTRYYYRVRAYNSLTNSAYSNVASAITQVPPLDPGNLQAVALSSSEIRLTWDDNSTDEDGFNIYRLEGEFMTLVGSVGANVSTFDDTMLMPNTPYYYTVRAYNDAGESGDSNVAFAYTQGGVLLTPAAPTGLVAVAISQSEIRLNWMDNSDNEQGFIIERAADPSLTWTQIDTVQPNQTQYVNMNLQADSTWFYRVRAYNAAGNSDPSNVAGATTSSAQGGGRRSEIVDGDGDVAIFTLVGVGGSITYTSFGDGGGIDTLYVAAQAAGVGSLNVTVVQAVGGDGRIQIGRIQGDIALGDLFVRVGTINFAQVDLVGDGAWLCNVNRATFGDLTGSASIEGQCADLTLRDVNTTGSITLCDVNSFRARSLVLGGGFTAHSVANLNVDTDADFALTTDSESGLGSMRIGGDATISLDVNRAGMINILGNSTFTGGSQVLDTLTRLKIGGSWISGSLAVGRLGAKLEVVGNVQSGAAFSASGGCIVICGDAAGTLNLDQFARITVKGNMTGGAVNVTNSSSGIVTIKGDFSGGEITTYAAGLWCLKVCGSMGASASFDSGGLLHKAIIVGSLAGSMTVGSADCIVVCADFTGDFTADGAEGQTVGKFSVKGAATGARFAAVGDVNCIILGELNASEIYVGLPADWAGGLPVSMGEFVRQSVLNKLQVRGGTDGATIAASTIANLCLREISDQQVFHLAAAHVDRAKMIVESQNYNLGPDRIFVDLPMLAYLDILQLLSV